MYISHATCEVNYHRKYPQAKCARAGRQRIEITAFHVLARALKIGPTHTHIDNEKRRTMKRQMRMEKQDNIEWPFRVHSKRINLAWRLLPIFIEKSAAVALSFFRGASGIYTYFDPDIGSPRVYPFEECIHGCGLATEGTVDSDKKINTRSSWLDSVYI